MTPHPSRDGWRKRRRGTPSPQGRGLFNQRDLTFAIWLLLRSADRKGGAATQNKWNILAQLWFSISVLNTRN
ncbi:hypothetical protein SBA2_170015 [Acidobacteriia bacterium SbA2]|nr:hypothetical protein SBA2_170015 [Acidobacteriia bacterium SbA2]